MWQTLVISCLLLASGAFGVKIIKPFPAHVLIVEGDQGVTSCVADGEGKPPANVTLMRWIQGDQHWRSASVQGRIVQSSTTEGNTTTTTMVIERSEVGDDTGNGKYACRAYSASNIPEDFSVTVKVIPKADIPVLAVTPPVVNATTGASVTLVCNLMHDGEYAIDAPTWTKDGEMVESDRRVEVDGKSLVLMAVTPADSGVYGCGQQINLVKGMLSPYNVTSATSELTVTDPPTTPSPGAAGMWGPHGVLVCLTSLTALVIKLLA